MLDLKLVVIVLRVRPGGTGEGSMAMTRVREGDQTIELAAVDFDGVGSKYLIRDMSRNQKKEKRFRL